MAAGTTACGDEAAAITGATAPGKKAPTAMHLDHMEEIHPGTAAPSGLVNMFEGRGADGVNPAPARTGAIL
ncbi:hypothetical protein GCM10010970_15630 [Silvimonas iriomotensis]|uniref:Uncharacterized protein n=1 Tax=Silvimonas iriomotensis TaxID=449662 RepID=A0ABQ2P887_9NEIS|nr:hypothetical protein GCM10010970_15630 [Silvimonas iriomotensis]